MDTLSKRCADSLRTFSKDHGVKLKPTHAHEIVAAFVGYDSNAAMRADKLCPTGNLCKADIYVLTPSAFIDQRRQCLKDLPSDLPDTYALGEALSPAIVEVFRGRFFATFSRLSEALTGEYLLMHGHSMLPASFGPFEKAHHIFSKPLYEFSPRIDRTDDGVTLVVTNRYYGSVDVHFQSIDVTITIKLKRIAGYVGYTLSDISAECRAGNANRQA
ncbi:MAG: hypothetical protein AB7F72_03395 [Afipia sp.]